MKLAKRKGSVPLPGRKEHVRLVDKWPHKAGNMTRAHVNTRLLGEHRPRLSDCALVTVTVHRSDRGWGHSAQPLWLTDNMHVCYSAQLAILSGEEGQGSDKCLVGWFPIHILMGGC